MNCTCFTLYIYIKIFSPHLFAWPVAFSYWLCARPVGHLEGNTPRGTAQTGWSNVARRANHTSKCLSSYYLSLSSSVFSESRNGRKGSGLRHGCNCDRCGTAERIVRTFGR